MLTQVEYTPAFAVIIDWLAHCNASRNNCLILDSLFEYTYDAFHHWRSKQEIFDILTCCWHATIRIAIRLYYTNTQSCFQDAAARLHLGVTTLKKICRRFSIKRWPYRKRSSIDKLIQRTKLYLVPDSSDVIDDNMLYEDTFLWVVYNL